MDTVNPVWTGLNQSGGGPRLWDRTLYLRDLAETGDFASFRVHGEEHGGGLRGLGLEQLERLVQGLRDRTEVRTQRRRLHNRFS